MNILKLKFKIYSLEEIVQGLQEDLHRLVPTGLGSTEIIKERAKYENNSSIGTAWGDEGKGKVTDF